MKIGEKVKLVDAGEVTITAIHEDTGRVEFELPDGRKGVVWPDGITSDDKSPAVPGATASVTHNGKVL